MHGFYGNILNIDLSARWYRVTPLEPGTAELYLGGKGLATYLLLKENPPGVDALSPENRLIFATGPAAGSPVWGGCRHGIYTKSPQTGCFAESYSGGTVAEYMAATGYDAIVIHGRSAGPVWLEIHDDGVVFHSAKNLWGKDTFATEDDIKEGIRREHPDSPACGVLCIGPAGENHVSFAVVENDYWRSAGRTGIGAVMGAKRLKGIAFRGNQKKYFADLAALKSFAKTQAHRAKTDAGVSAYKRMGTPMLVDIMNNAGGFPTRYWQKGRCGHAERINATALHERCEVKPHACRKCFIACGRLTTVTTGRRAGLTIEGPEYETIYVFGGLCEVRDIEDIAYLNDVCDRLGMDTISAGNLVAFAIEAVRQGKSDYAIDYGQVDAIERLLVDICHRKDIGDLLAQGIRVAADQWGMTEQAVHVKGLEPAGYDPRVLKGMGLAYGTSARGACHLRATFYKPELSGLVDPEKIEGKAAVFTDWEDRLTIFDTLILCRFYRDLYPWETLEEIVRGLIGLDGGRDQLRQIAARITDNTRRFNFREGATAADDHLPKRLYREALPETGKSIRKADMDRLLTDYYRLRGWDEKGAPPPLP